MCEQERVGGDVFYFRWRDATLLAKDGIALLPVIHAVDKLPRKPDATMPDMIGRGFLGDTLSRGQTQRMYKRLGGTVRVKNVGKTFDALRVAKNDCRWDVGKVSRDL